MVIVKTNWPGTSFLIYYMKQKSHLVKKTSKSYWVKQKVAVLNHFKSPRVKQKVLQLKQSKTH